MAELYRTDHRLITKRIIIRGTLVLDTPTCLGTGDADSPTDLPLLRDSLDDKYALLTGSSIAGALRNYLRERNKGYRESDRRIDIAAKLFGDLFAYEDEKSLSEKDKIKLKENDTQSSLIINDAISTQPIQSELRDGVKINSITRTAANKAKYDLELLQAGTEFYLFFELLIDKKEENKTKQEVYEAELCKGLAIALSGLEPKNDAESGEISLGMKKRRGFGRCHVEKWQVWDFDLTDGSDRMAWLLFDRECTQSPFITNKIADALGVLIDEGEDKRDRFTIQATFKLASPLLIRSSQAKPGLAPDVVHLKSYRPDESTEPVAVLSGTSLAGVLRHRAERIVNTLEKPTTIIDEIFGPYFSEDKTKEAKASRLIVHESTIKNTSDLVQTRIAIDRFTGGAYHGALFQEQPIFSSSDENLQLEIELRQPKDYEIGLLLLLLKDLWTKDLPVGGTSGIGRGRLEGRQARLTYWKLEKDKLQRKMWKFTQFSANQPLQFEIGEPNELETLVKVLSDYPIQEVQPHE